MRVTMKRTAAEWVPARYIQTERGSTPVPAFRRRWSQLRQLRWSASLVMASHPGVLIYVEKGRSWVGGRFQYGLFSVSVSTGGYAMGAGARSFHEVWTYLNGLSAGLDVGERVAS